MRENYEPFDNAEEVWLWFCCSMEARGDGLRSKSDFWGKPRLCEIGDIHKIIKKMRQNHHLSIRQLKVMIKWGQLQVAPYYERRAKRSEIALWENGISNFEYYLRQKQIL